MDAKTITHFQKQSSHFGGKFAVIDLKALQHNYRLLKKQHPKARICSCIKSNAYGHGLLEVAHALSSSDYLSVCDLSEATALYQAGFKNIVVFNLPNDLEIWKQIANMGLIGVFYNPEQLPLILELDQPIRLWVKINTGMNRLGLSMSMASQIIHQLSAISYVQIDALMSHFACSDQPNHPLNALQLLNLHLITDQFNYTISMSNSFGLIHQLSDADQIIRPGICLYGGDGYMNNALFKPVMQLWAQVIHIHNISAGESVGYGACFKASQNQKIAIVNFGYADGFPYIKNPSDLFVKIRGQNVLVVGTVSMNSFQIDISQIKGVRIGDAVMLWGERGMLVDFAKTTQTISYQLLCAINHSRVLFHYV